MCWHTTACPPLQHCSKSRHLRPLCGTPVQSCCSVFRAAPSCCVLQPAHKRLSGYAGRVSVHHQSGEHHHREQRQQLHGLCVWRLPCHDGRRYLPLPQSCASTDTQWQWSCEHLLGATAQTCELLGLPSLSSTGSVRPSKAVSMLCLGSAR